MGDNATFWALKALGELGKSDLLTERSGSRKLREN